MFLHSPSTRMKIVFGGRWRVEGGVRLLSSPDSAKGLFWRIRIFPWLTTNPEMHCTGCEKKIKDNIRFEKGIKSIKTNLDDKTITIEYDADKTTVEDIIKGFEKIKYEAREVQTTDTKSTESTQH